MQRRLALTEDGRMTWCTAPEDKIGQGRCNHVSHQRKNESNNDFIKRIENNQMYIIAHSEILDEENIDYFEKDDLGYFSYLTNEDINAGDYSNNIGGTQPKTLTCNDRYIKFDKIELDINNKIDFAFSYPSITETVCSSLIRNSDIYKRIRCADYHLGVYLDKNNTLNDNSSKTFSISEDFKMEYEDEYRLASPYGANKASFTLMKTEDYRSEIFETLKLNESKDIIINNIIKNFSNIDKKKLEKQFDDKCAIDILFGNKDIRNNPGNFIVLYNNSNNNVNIISMDYGRCLHFGETNTYIKYDDLKDFEPFLINMKEFKKECEQIKFRLRDENLKSFFNSSIDKLLHNLDKYPNLWVDTSN